jgi:hypothetical protein
MLLALTRPLPEGKAAENQLKILAAEVGRQSHA